MYCNLIKQVHYIIICYVTGSRKNHLQWLWSWGICTTKKTLANIRQNGIHVGEMTVKETLDFSARCQGVVFRYNTFQFSLISSFFSLLFSKIWFYYLELLEEITRREREDGILPEAEIDLFMKIVMLLETHFPFSENSPPLRSPYECHNGVLIFITLWFIFLFNLGDWCGGSRKQSHYWLHAQGEWVILQLKYYDDWGH